MESNSLSGRKTLLQRRSGKKRKNLSLLIMAIPFIIIVIMFFYVPIAGWGLSLFNYKAGIPLRKTPFVGLFNFELMLRNLTEILRVLRNTLVLGFLRILMTPLPVIFAIMLNEVNSSKFKKTVQVTTTIPNFVSWIIIYSLSFALFSSEGAVNNLMISAGLRQEPYNVMGDENAVWFF